MQTGSDVITKNSNTLLLSELERTDAEANTISAHLCHLKRTEQQKEGELIRMVVCMCICILCVYAIGAEGAPQTHLANFADNSFEFWQIACLAKRTFLVRFPPG